MKDALRKLFSKIMLKNRFILVVVFKLIYRVFTTPSEITS